MDFVFSWPWASALQLASTCSVNAHKLVQTQHFGAARTVRKDCAFWRNLHQTVSVELYFPLNRCPTPIPLTDKPGLWGSGLGLVEGDGDDLSAVPTLCKHWLCADLADSGKRLKKRIDSTVRAPLIQTHTLSCIEPPASPHPITHTQKKKNTTYSALEENRMSFHSILTSKEAYKIKRECAFVCMPDYI